DDEHHQLAPGEGSDGWNRERNLWDAWDDQAWDPETWEERHRAAIANYEESPSGHHQLPQRIPPTDGPTQEGGRYDASPAPYPDHVEVSAGRWAGCAAA